MKLIDADNLIKLTQKDMEFAFNNGFLDMAFEREHLIKVIRNQPIAYDIEKVVEQLEELADESHKAYCIAFNSDDRAEYDAYTNAIEIVKKMITN